MRAQFFRRGEPEKNSQEHVGNFPYRIHSGPLNQPKLLVLHSRMTGAITASKECMT
jgi:hypothetical protein